jgi:exopolysaccharide biosynthesis polyprenyl glycosylphosphotransferase
MFRRFSTNFALFSILMDALLIAFSLRLSALLRPLFSVFDFVKDIYAPTPVPPELYLIFPLIWVAVNLLFSIYDGRRNYRAADEFGAVTLAAALAGISMAGVLYLTYRDISRFLYLFFVALALFLMILWRALARLAFRWKWVKAVDQRAILILGAGEVGRKLSKQIHRQAGLGLRLAGFLDDDPAKIREMPGVLGPLDQVREVIQRQTVDDVVIALPLSAHERLNQIVSELHDLPVRVWVIPDYFSLTLHKASVEEFAGLPMLDLRAPALSEYQRMIKRGFDLLVTVLCLPLALPLMAVIALLIRLDSPGPVMYNRKRVGENGRLFTMYKFRTMVVGAEQMQAQVAVNDADGNHIHKLPDDPRVTRIGRFLRRTSLDELPQLFNVLQGSMSLVGPRPEMPELVENYKLWQRKRFTVPQGITGWWQINGRSDRPMHLHTEDDLYYVQHYSLWLDLQILIRTAWAVLRGRGAF